MQNGHTFLLTNINKSDWLNFKTTIDGTAAKAFKLFIKEVNKGRFIIQKDIFGKLSINVKNSE